MLQPLRVALEFKHPVKCPTQIMHKALSKFKTCLLKWEIVKRLWFMALALLDMGLGKF